VYVLVTGLVNPLPRSYGKAAAASERAIENSRITAHGHQKYSRKGKNTHKFGTSATEILQPKQQNQPQQRHPSARARVRTM
jgi:hypothetical protein